MSRHNRSDVWKSEVRFLQLQLRDRFRVAVDRHWRHRQHHTFILAADVYFSSTIKRWLTRFHDFRTESLPSSTSFYCKRVTRDFSSEEDSTLVRMMQAVAIPVLGNVCHVFMNGLNRVQVYGLEKLHSTLLHRPQGKPLLTWEHYVDYFVSELATIIYFHGASNGDKGVNPDIGIIPVKNKKQDQENPVNPSYEYKLPLVWIDLEMTSLNIEVDKILEIACIITYGYLTKTVEDPDLVIHQTKECLDRMGEWCQNHHEASGLTKKLLRSTISEGEAEKQ